MGLFPGIEQFTRLEPWLDGARRGNVDSCAAKAAEVRFPRTGDDIERDDDEQDLKNEATGHSQSDDSACAPMLRSRAPQLVRFPRLAAMALGGREHGKDSGTPIAKGQGTTA